MRVVVLVLLLVPSVASADKRLYTGELPRVYVASASARNPKCTGRGPGCGYKRVVRHKVVCNGVTVADAAFDGVDPVADDDTRVPVIVPSWSYVYPAPRKRGGSVACPKATALVPVYREHLDSRWSYQRLSCVPVAQLRHKECRR